MVKKADNCCYINGKPMLVPGTKKPLRVKKGINMNPKKSDCLGTIDKEGHISWYKNDN